MDYVQFGRTGIRVSPLCLGCMNFGGKTDEKTSVKIMHRALDSGINFWDTANVYNRGVSEEYVGKALKSHRQEVVLATKVHSKMGEGINERGNSRRHIMIECENSLKRLCTDHIDLYQIHRPEAVTPIDETLRALDDLRQQGKILYAGSSTFPAWELAEALWTSDRLNIIRFDSEQPPYSIMQRGIETEVLPLMEKYEVAIMPWSPLSGGWLTGKYTVGSQVKDARHAKIDWDTAKAQNRAAAVEKLIPIAQDKGVPLSQFSLAWCLSHSGVTSPIIGPRTVEHLEDNMKSLDVEITDEDRERVDAVVPPGMAVDDKLLWNS